MKESAFPTPDKTDKTLSPALHLVIDRVCDLRGDDSANRAALLAECAAQSPADQADLTEHFTEQVEAHIGRRDEAAITAFKARVHAIQMRGFSRRDAEEVAKKLRQRDERGDDLRMCMECSNLGTSLGRCTAAATGRLPGVDKWFQPPLTTLQRCTAFGLKKGLT